VASELSSTWQALATEVQREVWAFSDAVPGLPENLRVLIPLDWPPLPVELSDQPAAAPAALVPVVRTPAVTAPVLGIVLNMGHVVSDELAQQFRIPPGTVLGHLRHSTNVEPA
jgi:hypothetical protein